MKHSLLLLCLFPFSILDAEVRQMIAHRGAGAERPECTLSAIERAIEAGATATEVDVRTSRDGQLFILHDATLERTTNGKGPGSNLTLAELQELDAGSWFDSKYRGERIPSLIEVAQACYGRIDLLLDLKEQGDDYDRQVAKVILQHGEHGRTIVGVRSIAQAKRFRELLPKAKQLALIPNVESIEGFANAGVDTIRLWPRWLKDGDAPVRRVRATGKLLHLNGTVGELRETRELLKHDPDSLSSDHPQRLRDSLAKIAAEATIFSALIQKLDHQLAAQCEQAVRTSLDKRIARYGTYGLYPHKDRDWTADTINVDLEEGHFPNAAARFLRAYETFGHDPYLQAGLKTADFFIQIQHENGCFPTAARVARGGDATAIIGRKHKHPLGVARIEDAHQYPAFCLLLYAHKLTGQDKYLKHAKKWGNLFFEKIQYHEWGCSPDYWDGKARPLTEAQVEGDDWDYGIPNGGSYSDHATYDGFMTTMVMYHLTKDPKYFKYSSKLGQWIFLTHRGEGHTRGWADNYNRLNQPVPARHHEGFNIDPRNANRFTLPMMMWFHVMTGEARYRILFEETIAWLRSMEQPHGSRAPKHPWLKEASLKPIGWPSEYLSDGTEAWTTGYESYRYDQPHTWPQKLQDLGLTHGGHPKYTTLKVELSGAEQMLAILKSEGLPGWGRLFQGNAQWTPEQFLTKREEAAQRCLATTTLPESLEAKWQLVWDHRLATGKIHVKHAVHGGHGLLKWTESFTDLWNVHYDWTSRILPIDNWLDVPIPELQGFLEAEDATLTGAQISQQAWGHSGKGYVQPTPGPTSITWQVHYPQTGTFKLVIVWANGSNQDQPMDLIINNAAPQQQAFPGSNNANQWNAHVVQVEMQSGTNTITLQSESGAPHIDMIYFTEPIIKPIL